PLPVVFREDGQQVISRIQISAGDSGSDLTEAGIRLCPISPVSSISSVPAPAGAGCAPPGPVTTAAHFHNGVIGLVDLFHLLLGQILQRTVVIVVRVILSRQFSIGFFYLLIGGGTGDIKYLVRVVHSCSFSPPVPLLLPAV